MKNLTERMSHSHCSFMPPMPTDHPDINFVDNLLGIIAYGGPNQNPVVYDNYSTAAAWKPALVAEDLEKQCKASALKFTSIVMPLPFQSATTGRFACLLPCCSTSSAIIEEEVGGEVCLGCELGLEYGTIGLFVWGYNVISAHPYQTPMSRPGDSGSLIVERKRQPK
jgi:hypothetical protein